MRKMAVVIALFLGSVAAGGELRVAAAVSLAESMQELAARFAAAQDVGVRPVLAGSNVLARQIEQGAPIDVFLSADEATMRELRERRLVEEPVVLLGNALVVVVPRDASRVPRDAAGLARLGRLAIGDPDGVPAGRYARSWLEGRGCWDEIAARCVRAADVRAALVHAESGNVDAAIVYATDVAGSSRVKVAFRVPKDQQPVIRYPVAVCRDSRQAALARRFVEFLRSAEAHEVFRRRGFVVPAKQP